MRRPSVSPKAMIVKPTPSRLQLYHQALGLMALFRNSEKLALLRLIIIKVNSYIVKTLGRANRANHAQHLLCDPRSQSAGSENTFWWPTSVLKHSQPVKIVQKFKQNGPSSTRFSSFVPFCCPGTSHYWCLSALLVLIPISVINDEWFWYCIVRGVGEDQYQWT